jgi:hypothetical protein
LASMVCYQAWNSWSCPGHAAPAGLVAQSPPPPHEPRALSFAFTRSRDLADLAPVVNLGATTVITAIAQDKHHPRANC